MERYFEWLRLRGDFPALTTTNFSPTSPLDERYNCIGWAAGTKSKWWWPIRGRYWPPGVPREENKAAFVAAFGTLGYEECPDGIHEPQWEKIAIFFLNGIPTHGARQLVDGSWTSKLGRDIDVGHDLRALEGPKYGQVTFFMRRPRPMPVAPAATPAT